MFSCTSSRADLGILETAESPTDLRVERANLGFAMAQAIWNALLVFDLLPTGFSNRDLRNNLAALRGQAVDQFTQGRMTYQLRRLRLHGVIERIPKTHGYRLTDFGFRVAVFCTRTYARILRPGLGLVLLSSSHALTTLFR